MRGHHADVSGATFPPSLACSSRASRAIAPRSCVASCASVERGPRRGANGTPSTARTRATVGARGRAAEVTAQRETSAKGNPEEFSGSPSGRLGERRRGRSNRGDGAEGGPSSRARREARQGLTGTSHDVGASSFRERARVFGSLVTGSSAAVLRGPTSGRARCARPGLWVPARASIVALTGALDLPGVTPAPSSLALFGAVTRRACARHAPSPPRASLGTQYAIKAAPAGNPKPG